MTARTRRTGSVLSPLGLAVLLLTALTVLVCTLTPAYAAGPAGGPAAAAAAAPDPTNAAQVRALVDGIIPKQLAKYQIPGAAVVVVAGGRTVLATGYGVSNVAKKTPVTQDTDFFMGSDAKVFTSVAVLQLVQEGKLDLNADVNRYLTGFKIKDSYPGHPVTAENLLTHTAGFDDTFMGLAVAQPQDAGSLGASLAAHQPARVRPPGTATAYDNYGVALAGYLVEVISGEPFDRYLSEHVLQPLGMDRTSFSQVHSAAVDAGTALGYRPEGGGQVVNQGQYGPWAPTGSGAVTTAADMGRFLLAQLQSGRLGDQRILDAATAQLMQSRHFGVDPRLPGMAYLLEQRDRNGQQLLVKDGDVPGFHSNLALLPQRGVGVYVTYNGDGVDTHASYATEELVNDFVDHFYPAPAAAAPVATIPGDLARFTGDYRSTRTSHSNLTKAGALMGSVHVSAGADGVLTTTGPLSRNPDEDEQHWVQVQPGLFQQQGGQARIAFETDTDGQVTALLTDADPTIEFQPLAWYQAPGLHQQVALYSLGLVLLSLLGWVLGAVVRSKRSNGAERPAAPRLARLLAGCTGLLIVGATGMFAYLTSDSNAFDETLFLGDSGLLKLVPALLAAALVGTAGVLLCAVLAWYRRWWGLAGRLHYTVLAVAALLFMVVAGGYNLIGTYHVVGSLDLIG
ncbi:serine hydrolase domain-containing protein [Kitasatospora mediocidica]|uniref:serine hydrolase domain-containing protein n=1 Tax=Kitasatospora mediocidica TaxID=58352 RepID=UPI000690A2FD|nr:serine hydrolase domain-containing protein [Kitasatospora mediocidica]